MYAPLGNSYQWSVFNKNGQIGLLVQQALKEGKPIQFAGMQTAYSRLRNRDKSPIFSKIEEAVAKGQIIMLYLNKATLRIPVYLPFILMQGSGGVPTGVVFLDICGGREGDNGEILLDDRKLKVSLESCYSAIQFVLLQNSKKLEAPNLMRSSAKIYSGIVSECINRKHSIKLSPEIYNPILFILNKFFMGTVMGCTAKDDVMETYCLYNLINPDLVGIRKVADAFEPGDFKDISTVLQKMAVVPELRGRIGKLTVSGFIESYINMYDAAMLLALENYSYFFYNILSVKESTYVNNYQILKGIVGKEGAGIYAYVMTNICGA